MSLTNKTILITRSEDQADEFIELIESQGGKAILFPTIRIADPDDWSECDEAIRNINSFDGILFTSRNAVDKFLERFKFTANRLNTHTSPLSAQCSMLTAQSSKLTAQRSPLNALSSKLIFAVGEKTKSQLEKYGIKCLNIPETYTAEHLADTIKTSGVQNKKFLFPRGNLGRDILNEKLAAYGAEVISVIVYKTEKAIPENLSSIEKELLEVKIDVVTFTSPSTVKNFFSLFSESTKTQFTKNTIFAVIGKVTAEALLKFEVEPNVIAKPSTIEGLVEGIEKYYSV